MAVGEARIEFVGTLTADPELRFTPSGAAVANFSVAVNGRRREGDTWVEASTTFYRCAAWRELGENVAESLHRGDSVIVVGTFKTREYETDNGKGMSADVDVDAIGPNLRFATCTVQKANRQGGGQQPPQGGQQQGAWGGQPQQQGGAWGGQPQQQGAWGGQPQEAQGAAPGWATGGTPPQGQQSPQQGTWPAQQGAPGQQPPADPWATAGQQPTPPF